MKISAIDMHSHINTASQYDSTEDAGYHADIDWLNQIRIGAFTEKMFISSFASVKEPSVIESENELVFDICQKNDYLYQWVVIDPRVDGSFLQAKKLLLTKKCVGIKLHPAYHKYSLEDYARKLFSFAAEYDAKVLIHANKSESYIVPIADKYSNVTFIMAHLNAKDNCHIDAIRMSKHKNIYTDIATSGSVKNRVLEYAVSQIGSERIMYGTDTYSPGFIRGRVDYALISQESKDNILRNNALQLWNELLG